MADTSPKKTCFVVMGFGKKTDFQQQKTYDLDKSYRIIIKQAWKMPASNVSAPTTSFMQGLSTSPCMSCCCGLGRVEDRLSVS